LAVLLGTQGLIHDVVEVLANEAHTTIAKQKIGTANMRGLETDFRVPIVGSAAGIGSVVIAGVVVDRDQRRAVSVAIVRLSPAVAYMLGVLRPHFAKE